MEICCEWSLDDLYDAHAVLDVYDELERRQALASRRDS